MSQELTPIDFRKQEFSESESEEEKEFWDNKTLKVFKKHYTETYGIKLKIPAHYILDAKFYPGDQRYKVVLANYVLPEEHDFEVVQHKKEETYEEYPETEFFSDIVDTDIYKYLHLKLLKFEDGLIRCVSECPIDAMCNAQFSFSNNGEFMAIYQTEKYLLKIFKIPDRNIQKLFEQLINENNGQAPNKPFYELNVQEVFQIDKDMENVPNRIKFGAENKFFAIYGEQKACVIKLVDKPEILTMYVNDRRLFSQILDLQVSNIPSIVNGVKSSYTCEVASLDANYLKLYVHNIFDKQVDKFKMQKSIYFGNKKLRSMVDQEYEPDTISEKIMVCISEDFQSVILSYEQHKYILSLEQGVYKQTSLQLQKMKIKYIQSFKSHFYLICCNEFDQNISIISTCKDWGFRCDNGTCCFSVEIQRQLESNQFRAFNLVVDEELNQIKLVSARDQQIFSDQIQMATKEVIENCINKRCGFQNCFTNIYKRYEQQTAFCFNWPFYSYQVMRSNVLWLIDLNKPNLINFIEMPEGVLEILNTDITQTYELYVLCLAETNGDLIVPEKCFQLYVCDLEDYENHTTLENQKFRLQKVFSISRSGILDCIGQNSSITDVNEDNLLLKDMLVRNSNKKESYIQQNKSMVFLLFNNFLLLFIEDKPNRRGQQPIEFVCETKSERLIKLNDLNFLVQQQKRSQKDKQKIEDFQLSQVHIKYNSFKITDVVYRCQTESDQIISYSLDSQYNILILYYEIYDLNKIQYRIKLIQLDKDQKVFYETEIKNKELISRLKCGMFTVSYGHIYFANKVIKIRYDLIKQSNKKGVQMLEKNAFDFYDNLLDLDNQEVVEMMFPFSSLNSQKLIYITQQDVRNRQQVKYNKFQAKTILAMPFLHGRKIFTGHCNPNKKYFNLTMVSEKGFYKRSGSNGSQKFNMMREQKLKIVMVTINFTDSKYHVYEQNGVLKYTESFKDTCDEYGTPISVSNDGKLYLFLKQKGEKSRYKFFAPGSLTQFSVLQINLNKQSNSGGFQEFQGKLDIEHIISKFHNDFQGVNMSEVELQADVNDFGNIIFGVRINDYFEIVIIFDEIYSLIRITPPNSPKNQEKNDKIINFTMNDSVQGFSANKLYLIIWSKYEIFFRMIDDNTNNFKKIDISIQRPDSLRTGVNSSQILRVMTSQANELIAIEISQPNSPYKCLIGWQVLKNRELNSIELERDSHVIFDSEGDIYAINNGQVIDLRKQVRMTCFKTKYLTNQEQGFECENDQLFRFSKGTRMDSVNNEWLFIKNFILVPYSYMTFVIMQQHRDLKTWKHPDYKFDIEQYDFIYKSSTYFTLNESVCQDYEHLRYILYNMKQHNPILLDLLQYYSVRKKTISDFDEKTWNELNMSSYENPHAQNKIIDKSSKYIMDKLSKNLQNIISAQREEIMVITTPLHIATWNKQSRSIKLILDFMVLINRKNLRIYTDIIPSMLEQTGFTEFINSIMFETKLSSQVNNLRSDFKFSDDIVKFNTSSSSYIDNQFMEQKMGQIDFSHEKDNKIELFKKDMCYPIQINMMNLDWIVETEQGKKFLLNLLSSENLRIYETQSINQVISFIYSQFKMKIIYTRLPLYIFQIISIGLATQINPKFSRKRAQMEYFTIQSELFSKYLTLVVTLATILLCLQQIRITRRSFFKHFWNYYELCYIICSIIYIVKMTKHIHCWEYIPESGHVKVKSYYKTESSRFGFELYPIDCQQLEATNREVQAFLVLFVCLRSLAFLQLNDNIAPMVMMINIIFYEIRYFVIIITCCMSGFVGAYYLIGQNQLLYDFLPVGDQPQYSNIIGAIKYTFSFNFYQMFKFEEYAPDPMKEYQGQGFKNSQFNWLFILCLIQSFFIFILLTNLLIALMGQVQSRETQNSHRLQLQHKLQIIIDNWWINPLANKNIKYLVTAQIKSPLNQKNLDIQERVQDLQDQFNILKIDCQNMENE